MPDVTFVTVCRNGSCRNGRNYFCTIKPMKGDTTMSYNDWKDKTVSFKMSKKSGIEVEAIIERIKGLINQHINQ